MNMLVQLGSWENIPLFIAKEMMEVGAVPCTEADEIPGFRFKLAGTPAILITEITREDFMQRVAAAGFNRSGFEKIPAYTRFCTLSID